MDHNPRCWHCTHPRAYWATVISLVAVLFFGRIVEALALLALFVPVLAANVIALARLAVMR